MNVLPDYGGASLADVLPAVGRALGMPGEGALELPPASAYVVVLLDGLGAELLARHTEQTPFLSSGSMKVGTCGVPSTTATSLTSLGTALPPGAHGLVGFTSRIPGTDRLLQALRWDKSVDPQRWQPHEPYFATLERHGIATTVISKAEFEHSGLTQCGQRGARFVGAQTLTERVDHAVRAAQRAPSVTYIYDNDPDHTGHAHGVGSARWRAALDDADATLEQLRESLPASVKLLVVADHGMVDPSVRVDIDEVPHLRSGLTLLGGEARFRHLYCRTGAVEDVRQAWSDYLGDRATIVTREEGVAAGWFGEVDPEVAPRLGDLMVVCGPELAVLSSRDFAIETQLVGMHGAMTDQEMLIPIVVH